MLKNLNSDIMMMEVILLESLYFCECCRKRITEVTEIHYVEENSDRGFCSDKCIMDFYRPFLDALEAEELEFRKSLNIENEDPYLEITSSQNYLQQALKRPSEIWITTNDLDQNFYTHILKVQHKQKNIYFVLVCSYVEQEAAFVFYRMCTQHIELVKKYQRQMPYKEESGEVQVAANVPSEIFETIELKKSTLLAEMLTSRSMHDIAFEDFPSYEEYFQKTLEDPDEVFEKNDEDGDPIHTYIKSFKMGDESFFYIVVGLYFEAEESMVIPIISFPSVDKKIYPHYAVGNKIINKLKN